MWVFLNDAFFSIVENMKNKNQLLVRARIDGDIERVFPDAFVFQDEKSDYKYRSFINRDIVAEKIKNEVASIDYSNFKNSVEEEDRHDVYTDVWGVMYKHQNKNDDHWYKDEWWKAYRYK